jgi:hypothetical protein
MELAIVRLIQEASAGRDVSGYRIIYLAPTKASQSIRQLLGTARL